jgi:fumarylpyruvate hydrolase
MTDFMFPIRAHSVEISGRAERFAVRRIFCVGRNYAEHAKEFGNDECDPPFFSPNQPMPLCPAALF